MKASTIAAALVTSCGLALAVSSHPASALQQERVPTLEIASEEEVNARKELEELEARTKVSRLMANLRAESALALARARVRLNCEDGAKGFPPPLPTQDRQPRLVEDDIGSGFRFSRGIGGNDADYGRRLCTDLEDGNFLAMTRAGVERLREAEIEPSRDYGTEFLVFSDGTLIEMDVGASADISEDPEGSDEAISDEDSGADGAGIDDLDDDAGGDFGDDPDPRPTTGGNAPSEEFDEDPEGSDDDIEPADDSTAGSVVDPDAVIPPQRTGATGLSGQFDASNENGIIFGALIWSLYGPGGVEVQNYRRNQLVVDLVPGATYRVVAREPGENGRTAELTFTPEGTGFTFTRGLRFQ